MDKQVWDRFNQLCSPNEYQLLWEESQLSGEWGSLSQTIWKAKLEIIALDGEGAKLKALKRELENEANLEEAIFRFFDDDLRVHFDPATGKQILRATVFFSPGD